MFRNKSKNWWFLLVLSTLTVTAMLVFSVIPNIVFAGTPMQHGGTFEDADGDLQPNTSNPQLAHDWNDPIQGISCATSQNCGLDFVNSQADNALGQGAKEDNPCPSVVTGSIPPSKDDLSRFYVNIEQVTDSGGNKLLFLYLAWERSNLLGSAHMDFELNQSSTLCANGVSPLRTAGDMLIDYDFGGSGVPVLAVHRWITTGNPATDCESSNTLPCWNKGQTLTGSEAEGQVNSAPVTDTNPPNAPFIMPGNTKNGINSTFGEAGIDLTDSGIFPSNVCTNFGQAWLKSRSSGNSFTSEMKDFIAPISVQVSNCGQLKVVKVTDPSPDPTNSSFGFQLDDGALQNTGIPKTFSLVNGGSDSETVFAGSSYSVDENTIPSGWDFVTASCDNGSGTLSGSKLTDISVAIDTLTTCTFTNQARGTIIIKKITDDQKGSFVFTSSTLSPSPFTLTTTAANTAVSQTFSNLSPGSFDAAETVPSGWTLVSSACDNGDSPASISLGPGETITCTFHDAPQKGAILVVKTAKNAALGAGDHPEAGVTFTVTGGELPAGGVSKTTDANGKACFDGLVLSSFVGDYTVQETTPSGYSADSPSATITVSTQSSCGDGKEVVAPFHNTPLTDITVTINSQVVGGTSSTIVCKASDNTTISSGSTDPSGDGSVTATNLLPDTYTCTIVVDP